MIYTLLRLEVASYLSGDTLKSCLSLKMALPR